MRRLTGVAVAVAFLLLVSAASFADAYAPMLVPKMRVEIEKIEKPEIFGEFEGIIEPPQWWRPYYGPWWYYPFEVRGKVYLGPRFEQKQKQPAPKAPKGKPPTDLKSRSALNLGALLRRVEATVEKVVPFKAPSGVDVVGAVLRVKNFEFFVVLGPKQVLDAMGVSLEPGKSYRFLVLRRGFKIHVIGVQIGKDWILLRANPWVLQAIKREGK